MDGSGVDDSHIKEEEDLPLTHLRLASQHALARHLIINPTARPATSSCCCGSRHRPSSYRIRPIWLQHMKKSWRIEPIPGHGLGNEFMTQDAIGRPVVAIIRDPLTLLSRWSQGIQGAPAWTRGPLPYMRFCGRRVGGRILVAGEEKKHVIHSDCSKREIFPKIQMESRQ